MHRNLFIVWSIVVGSLAGFSVGAEELGAAQNVDTGVDDTVMTPTDTADVTTNEESSDAAAPESMTSSETAPEMISPSTGERSVELSDDPLDEEETEATIAVVSQDSEAYPEPATTSVDVDQLLDRLKPFGKGDMELSIGVGGSGYGGFTLAAGALFAYYVVNQLAPGLEIDYQATWGDLKYPQSLTVFPFLKFVLIRSHRFAPYLLAGAGRTFEWGGEENGFNSATGELTGYAPVSSWVTGFGGGFMIGIGARARIQIQLLAMYRVMDEAVWRDAKVVIVTETDTTGNSRTYYRLSGEHTDRYWAPAPSFWFSFAL